MSDASQFPVTTGYGQIPGYPLNNGFHKGEDRAMPRGTPVIVNGVEIGKSGTTTGPGGGPHLHIGSWVGGQSTPPNGGGFQFGSAVVTEIDPVGVVPLNGRFVRVQAEGASWVYLHLDEVSAHVGQVLKEGGDMASLATKDDVKRLALGMFGEDYAANMTEKFVQDNVGTPLPQLIEAWISAPEALAYRRHVKEMETGADHRKLVQIKAIVD